MEKIEQQPKRERANIEEIEKKRIAIYEDMDKYQKYVEFANRLRKKYPDCGDYLMWHIMAGSTPVGEPPKFDFPGEDSLEKFINSLTED